MSESSTPQKRIRGGAAMMCDDVRPLLNARMDGEIDSRWSAAVDRHINTCDSCADDLRRLEALRDLIRDTAARTRAPDALRDHVIQAVRGATYLEPRRTIDWNIWRAVAAAVLVIALASSAFFLFTRNRAQIVAEDILSAHKRALVGRDIDIASSDRHTVKPWFNGKVPFSPPVIDLANEGFPLSGGRLDYLAGHPAAALVYHRRLHQIDVFIWPARSGGVPPPHFSRDGYNEIFWKRNGFAFTAISDLNSTELSAFTQLLQTR
jgi:anti-sigma factor RsiW